MSTSLCVKAEVLGLLQRPAVLWSLVALVSVPEQQQPLWFQPWGVNISQRWRAFQGAWLGCGLGRGPSPVPQSSSGDLGWQRSPVCPQSHFPLGGAIG